MTVAADQLAEQNLCSDCKEPLSQRARKAGSKKCAGCSADDLWTVYGDESSGLYAPVPEWMKSFWHLYVASRTSPARFRKWYDRREEA